MGKKKKNNNNITTTTKPTKSNAKSHQHNKVDLDSLVNIGHVEDEIDSGAKLSNHLLEIKKDLDKQVDGMINLMARLLIKKQTDPSGRFNPNDFPDIDFMFDEKDLRRGITYDFCINGLKPKMEVALEQQRQIENQEKFMHLLSQLRTQRQESQNQTLTAAIPKSSILLNQSAVTQPRTPEDQSTSQQSDSKVAVNNRNNNNSNRVNSHLNGVIMSNGLAVARRIQSDIFGKCFAIISGGKEWKDNQESADLLLSLVPTIKELPSKYHLSLNCGDRTTWEIPLLHYAFSQSCATMTESQHSELGLTGYQQDFTSTLCDLYNTYVATQKVVDTADFKEDMTDLLELLDSFGLSKGEMDAIKSTQRKKEVSELRNQIKQLIVDHDYLQAIKLCTERLSAPGVADLSPHLVAKLYFYRGYSSEMLHFKEGQNNAPRDNVLLDLCRMRAAMPSWKCTPFLMSVILYHDGKLEEAKTTATSCLVIDPDYKRANDLIKFIEYDLTVISTETTSLIDNLLVQFENALKENKDMDVANGLLHLNGNPRNMSKAIECFQAAPENPLALILCGALLQQEKTVYRDFIKSFKCFSSAYSHGLTKETVPLLVRCYRFGIGVEKNFEKAITLLEEQIQKYPEHSFQIMTDLGYLYLEQGNPKMETKAAQLFQTAASAGFSEAMLALGTLYIDGVGVKQDFESAKLWLSRANELKHPGAKERLYLLKDRKRFERLPDQTKEIIKGLDNIKVGERSPITKIRNTGEEPYPLIELEKYAPTSNLAARLLYSKSLFFHSLELMDSGQSIFAKDIISNMARCIEISELIFIMELVNGAFMPILEWYLRRNPMDHDARYCYATFKGLADLDFGIRYTQKCLQDFPNSHQLYITISNFYAFKANWRECMKCLIRAKEIITKKKLPMDTDIYFSIGICKLQADEAYNDCRGDTNELISDLKHFLKVCDKDDRQRPAIYYTIAYRYFKTKDNANAKKYFQMGLESEQYQLPFFLPYDSPQKKVLIMKLNISKDQLKLKKRETKQATILSKEELTNQSTNSTSTTNTTTTTTTTTTSTAGPVSNIAATNPSILHVHTQNSSIESHQRRTYTTQLRRYVSSFVDKSLNSFVSTRTISTKPIVRVSKDVSSGYKELFANDFDPNRDMVYKGRFIKGIIVERPFKIPNVGAHSIMMDNKGTYIRISIYDSEITNQSIADSTLFIGQGITVLDPYHRVGLSGDAAIKVESIKNLVSDGSQPNQVCYYCLKNPTGKLQICSNCRSAHYCSRECQVNDYKILDHKSICFKFTA